MALGVVPDSRVWFGLYNLCLVGGLGAVTVAALAACQVAIHHAFRAGLETGQASVWDQDTAPVPHPDEKADPLLRLVED
jgi:hypothetical protein